MGDPNWCPDCGEMRGICQCENRDYFLNDDGEPDFTLDDLEWDDAYPELSEDNEYCNL
jgi:hypothetical protein